MSPRRFYFFMQLIFIFFRSRSLPSASECLRLVWNSIPDAFFTFEEIEMALQADLSSETIRELYKFYSDSVGADPVFVEPRSLKQLSRPAVRRILCERGHWIPDGIKLLDVPKG
ncbi:unnamed protein product, partial [Larinioides sclopetarius]